MLIVMQEEACLKVQCGGRGCGGGDELKGTNIVVSRAAMMAKEAQLVLLTVNCSSTCSSIPGVGQSVLIYKLEGLVE